VIGATTAFFMGLLGIVANDIKRVVAYSTLSQLGYMTVALGVSAYSGAIFHLMTHAFFKALLFLAAGSVIIGMHHEQDMRKMGGLAKYMPWTAVTSWIGSLALIGTPFFAGFYSKDAIIEAVGESHRWGHTYAYVCVLSGVFVTAFYTFRMLFMTFHGPERFHEALAHGHGHDDHTDAKDTHGGDAHAEPDHDDHGHGGGVPHETPWVVRGPLVALAIPSIVIGALCVKSVLFGDYFGKAIFVLPANDVVAKIGEEMHDPIWLNFALKGFTGAPFWLALAGVISAWVFFLKKPEWADAWAKALSPLRTLLINKFYFDWFNENVVCALVRGLGKGLWRAGDQIIIDGGMVNGTANSVGRFGGLLRHLQSGYLYTYAFWTMIGLALLLGWFLVR
jgi:NADH-quinone oxidoreductase subunit L